MANRKEADLDYSITYDYNNVDNPTLMTAGGSSKIITTYDSFGRKKTDNYNTTDGTASEGVWIARDYWNIGAYTATNLISQYRARFTSTSTSGQNPDYSYDLLFVI